MQPLEPSRREHRRQARLLTAVSGLSGATYAAGTLVTVSGRGESVDGFVAGDWLPLRWWEYVQLAVGPLHDH